MASKSKIRKLLGKLIEIDHEVEFDSQDREFGYARVIVRGQWVRRPFYIFYGDTFLVIDAPFALQKEVKNLSKEMGLWGVGSVGQAFTIHNVFQNDFVLDSAGTFIDMLSLLVAEAGEKEAQIEGKVNYLVPPNDATDDQVRCEICQKFFPEDEILYFDEEDDGHWVATCETCNKKF